MGASDVVTATGGLGFPYKTLDPFLFCVYHKDLFPAGNTENMNAPRRGNGADFDCARGACGAAVARGHPC